MVKVRLWGEPAELDEMIERICNSLPGVRVLSISRNYKDRGDSVYKRCYMELALTEQGAAAPTPGTAEPGMSLIKRR